MPLILQRFDEWENIYHDVIDTVLNSSDSLRLIFLLCCATIKVHVLSVCIMTKATPNRFSQMQVGCPFQNSIT